jgi:glycosyltransferase involved in cell wall biosynthesis
MKPKLLCILHYSPPIHGASKVGDFIRSSEKLKEEFDCVFIKIRSSDTIADIGKISLKKIYFMLVIFSKVLFSMLVFRPDKIYFTASVRGAAFYRDLLLSVTWKFYRLFAGCEVFYHYHTKGIKSFVVNNRNKILTKYFLKDVNLILLSQMLEDDFEYVKTYKKVFYLPNGVGNNYDEKSFDYYLSKKDFSKPNVLFLSHMMREKGCFESIELANKFRNRDIHFHFAGSWQNESDKEEFLRYIKVHDLSGLVTLHGFLSGTKKVELFEKCHVLLYPSKNDAFPLTLLEALSYGVPVLATNEGSIPFIIDNNSGIVIRDFSDLKVGLESIIQLYLNIKTSKHCRQRYLENFSLTRFEENLIEVLG